MDGVGAAVFRDLQNLVDVEVRLSRGGSTDGEGLVRHQNVQRGAIHIRIDRHRGNSQLAAGTDDPHRDLPPISDKNLLEHDLEKHFAISTVAIGTQHSAESWPIAKCQLLSA